MKPAQLAVWIATLGPVGRFPKAPGTMGTAVALAVVALAQMTPAFHMAMLVASIVIGTWAAHLAEEAMGKKDPGSVVIDEFAGYLQSTVMLPLSWPYLLASFVLFRVLDIFKPWPIRKLQDMKGGVGIMADDIAAGIIANAALQIWMRLFA